MNSPIFATLQTFLCLQQASALDISNDTLYMILKTVVVISILFYLFWTGSRADGNSIATTDNPKDFDKYQPDRKSVV